MIIARRAALGDAEAPRQPGGSANVAPIVGAGVLVAVLSGSPFLISACAWEAFWWAKRRARRSRVYAKAQARARQLRRPLAVIGAPDSAVTSGYGCGDLVIDLMPSTCPNSLQADITKPLPLADSSVVAVVMCVLEYVDDVASALREIVRISGGEAFFVGVEPFTMVAHLFPGAKRTLPSEFW